MKNLVQYMITDHRPPLLVSAHDVRFGIRIGPTVLLCPSCGDEWYGVCPACVEWGCDPDVNCPAPDPWDGGGE